MRVGGPDKGGVAAYGTSEGVEKEWDERGRGSKSAEIRKEIKELKSDMKRSGIPKKSVFNGGHTPESYRANARLFELNTKLERAEKDELVEKAKLQATSGGQSEGSSLTARRFYVVDGQGRVLHTFMTREEAEQASAGNRYTKVVTHVEQGTPPEAAEVRDMLRRRPADTQNYTFRRSVPFPSPLPGSPQGR